MKATFFQRRWKRTCLSTTAGSEAAPAGTSGPRHAAGAPPSGGPPSGRAALPCRAMQRGGWADWGLSPEQSPEPASRWSLESPGPSYSGTRGQQPDGLPSRGPSLPPSLPAGRLTDEDAQVLEAGERVLAGVQHLLRGFPHVPVRLLGEHPAGPGPVRSGPAPAPRSRGGERPPDPPAPGPLHSQRRQRRLLLAPAPMRRGWRGAARSQLPAGPEGGRAGPGLDSPFLLLLPLLHDSRQVRPQASLWQPRRDVTAGAPQRTSEARRRADGRGSSLLPAREGQLPLPGAVTGLPARGWRAGTGAAEPRARFGSGQQRVVREAVLQLFVRKIQSYPIAALLLAIQKRSEV